MAEQCSASQLMQYCAYFARKHQLQIIATLDKENVDVLHILATKARLKELQHACVPYLLPAKCCQVDDPSYVLFVCGVVALWPFLTNFFFYLLSVLVLVCREGEVKQSEESKEEYDFNSMMREIDREFDDNMDTIPPSTPPRRGKPPNGLPARERMWSA